MANKAQEYRDHAWNVFRREVIELEGGVCRRCGRGEGEVVLQVHHQRYLPGLKPWEYAYRDCEAICKRCHAETHGRIVPKSGWEYHGQDDLGDLCGACEYCGSSLRYIFHIYHDGWGWLAVGTVCCDTLTKTDTASVYARLQRGREGRAERFVASPRWRCEKGVHKIVQKQFAVELQHRPGGYVIVINRTVGRQLFPQLVAAKRKVFAVIDSGAAEKYFARPPK